MAAAIAAILYGDAVISERLGYAFYPFLFVFVLLAGFLATRELVAIIGEPNRPHEWVCQVGVLGLLASHFGLAAAHRTAGYKWVDPQSWQLPAIAFGSFVLFTFLVEMYRYRATGHSITKIAHSLLVIAYLGVLPSFFLKLRWLRVRPDPTQPGQGPAEHDRADDRADHLRAQVPATSPPTSSAASSAASRRSPRCSARRRRGPGSSAGSAGRHAAAVILACSSAARRGWRCSNFGWVEAVAVRRRPSASPACMGDLAESLIKRDANAKDSSQAVPGFGGLLDVFDSVLFAGPVAYLWFRVQNGNLSPRRAQRARRARRKNVRMGRN